MLNILLASFPPQIKSPLFSVPPGHVSVDQKYGLKINDHQLFFPQAYGTEVNYCPSLDLSVTIYQTKELTLGQWMCIENKI